jgi:hypothetical protein
MNGLSDNYWAGLTNDYIRRQALTLRYMLGIDNEAAPDLCGLLEYVLPDLIPSFEFAVVTDGEIGGDGGLTSWQPPSVLLEEHVYKALLADNVRSRFTVCHELGHLMLHRGQKQARNSSQVRHVSALHSLERQANRFAIEFCLPHAIIKDCKVPLEVAKLCKVSVETAERRMRELAMWPRGDEREAVRAGFKKLIEELKKNSPR